MRAVSSRAFAGLHELYAHFAYDLGSQAKRSGVALMELVSIPLSKLRSLKSLLKN